MIETRYPGVYLTEIATGVHPIEGVSTKETGHPGVYLTEIPTGVHPIDGVSTQDPGYPGVYLTEIPTGVHPIDGVPTSTAASRAAAEARPAHTPDWTDHKPGDPGITLLQLFAFLSESMLYRANLVPERDANPVTDAPPPASDGSTAKIRKP